MSKKFDLFLSLGDHHHPFEDQRAVKESNYAIKHYKPSHIMLLGDLCDCYSISKYMKDPARKETLQDEFDISADYLQTVRSLAPKATVIYLEGNHEERLHKYLCSSARELGTLRTLSIPAQLNLASLDINYVKYGQQYKIGDCRWIHGVHVRKGGGNSVRGHITDTRIHTMMGHSHRLAHMAVRDGDRTYHGFENGCLCSMSQAYLRTEPDWQHGFTVMCVQNRRLSSWLQIPLDTPGMSAMSSVLGNSSGDKANAQSRNAK